MLHADKDLSRDFKTPDDVKKLGGDAQSMFSMGAAAMLFAVTERIHERSKSLSASTDLVDGIKEYLSGSLDDLQELGAQMMAESGVDINTL